MSKNDDVVVKVRIGRSALMQALRDMTINCEDFNHDKWSIWDAEVLESAARMIREGYSVTLPKVAP